MWAATAERPSAAIRRWSTPAGSGTMSAGRTTAYSAMLPSPGCMPAVVANQTAVPSASSPTPCTPGTYGVAGVPK
jgi:hypothetical protein